MPRRSSKLAPIAAEPVAVKTPDALIAELAARYQREHPDAKSEGVADPLYMLYCLAMSDNTPVDQKRMAWAELAKYQQPAVKAVEVGMSSDKKGYGHVTVNLKT